MRLGSLFTCFMLVYAALASADVVTLTNGDRLTGAVGVLQEGAIKVTTELAGEVSIPWANVSGIESAGPLAIRGADDTVLEGQLVFSDGSQFIRTAEGLEPIVLGQVQAIGASAEALAAAPAPEEAEKPDVWSGVIDMGASWRSGSRSTVDARSTVTATREKPKNKLTLMMDAAYGEDEDVANKQSIKGEAKWQFFPKDRFYYYGLVGAEHDDIRKLEIRLNGAIGLGYVFVKNETRTFSADAGIDYAHERWELYSDIEKDARRDEIRAAALAQLQTVGQSIFGGTFQPNLRNIWGAGQAVGLLYDPGIDNGIDTKNNVSLRLSSHYEQMLFEKAQIMNDLTLLPELEDVGELRLTNNLGFTTPLSESLSLKLAVKSEFDSDPGETVSKWDHLFTTGVQYKF